MEFIKICKKVSKYEKNSPPGREFFSYFDAFFHIFINSIEFLVFLKVILTFYSNFLNNFSKFSKKKSNWRGDPLTWEKFELLKGPDKKFELVSISNW